MALQIANCVAPLLWRIAGNNFYVGITCLINWTSFTHLTRNRKHETARWTSTNSAGSHVPCSWLGSVPSKVLPFRKHQFQSGPQGENRLDFTDFRPLYTVPLLKIYGLILKVDISKASIISKAVTAWKNHTHQETERKTIAAVLSSELHFTHVSSNQWCFDENFDVFRWKWIPFAPFQCRLFRTHSWSLFLRMHSNEPKNLSNLMIHQQTICMCSVLSWRWRSKGLTSLKA